MKLKGKQFKNRGLHQGQYALFPFHGEADVTAALVGLLLPRNEIKYILYFSVQSWISSLSTNELFKFVNLILNLSADVLDQLKSMSVV